MLEGLNEIDWNARNLPDIPKWILGLASQDSRERIDAYNDLQQYVIYGEDQYFDLGDGISIILSTDAPDLIVPFLIELLKYENIQDMKYVLLTLGDLASYVDMKDEGEIYHQRARKIREAVWEAKNTYILIFEHGTEEARMSALELIAKFSRDDEQIIDYMAQALSVEKDKHIKTSLAQILKDLG